MYRKLLLSSALAASAACAVLPGAASAQSFGFTIRSDDRGRGYYYDDEDAPRYYYQDERTAWLARQRWEQRRRWEQAEARERWEYERHERWERERWHDHHEDDED